MKMNKKIYNGFLVLVLIIFFFSIFTHTVIAATSTSFPNYGTIIGTSSYGGLNVRKGPSTSYASLGRISDGTLVKLESETNGWYKITYKDQTAYIYGYNGNYVSINNNYASNNKILYTGTVSASGGLNVRKGPSTSYASLGRISDGTKVHLLSEKSNGWYKITYNNQVAYISGTYVKNIVSCVTTPPSPSTSNPNATVIVADLNVRKGPGTSYASLGKLPYGYQVEILEKTSNGWYKITYNNQKAYIYGYNGKYVATDSKAASNMGIVVDANEVNIRSTPNIPSVYEKNVITKVIGGAILRILEDDSNPNDEWIRVEANALKGYIHKDYFDELTVEEYHALPKGGVISSNVIATFQTKISKDAHDGSVANIKSGAAFVNGTIVAPGQTFDYYGITHPSGFQYELAPTISNGETVLDRGGGLCQVSTTINAAIRHAKVDHNINNGLNVTARFLHGIPSSYVSDRRDEAMISSYYKTFAFRNTNTYSVQVFASVSNNIVTVTIVKI